MPCDGQAGEDRGMSKTMIDKFAPEDRVIWTNSATLYRGDLYGKPTEGAVKAPMHPGVYDRDDVGPMYVVNLDDGTEVEVFEDELERIEA